MVRGAGPVARHGGGGGDRLAHLGLLLPLVKRLAPGLDARALAAELRERVAEELDYEIEAQNHRAPGNANRLWKISLDLIG